MKDKRVNREENKFENCLVIGTGYSTNHLFEDVRYQDKIKGKTTIAFQAAFHYAYEKWGYIPDAWTWSDPHAALEGMRFILENPKLFKERKKQLDVLIPNFADTKHRKEFKDYAGSSPIHRNNIMKDYYYNSLERLKKQRNINVKIKKVQTTKLIKKRPDLTKDCKNIFENPVERFIVRHPIIGSFEYISDNSNLHVWGQENKLSFYIFPVLVSLGCKNLDVVGFDFGGSRFYDDNSLHSFKIEKGKISENPVCNIINTWAKEWYNYHNMKIISPIVESGLTKILEEL